MDIFRNLNPIQQEAVKKTDGAVLILAGAGSGKTRVLTHKVAYLMSKGVMAENILAVTFTNKAANEMKERVIKLTVHGSRFTEKKKSENRQLITVNQLPFIGTFHAFCAKVLRFDGQHVGLSRSFTIYDDGDSLSLVKKIFKDLGFAPSPIKPSSVLNAISSSKNELVSPSDYIQFASTSFGERVAKVYALYQKELTDLNACDFDDLLLKTVFLFRDFPQIKNKYASRFKYVLVDEYQDVNTAQYTLTKQLASVHGNLTVVGDASQAIYSFRGADFRNILNFKNDFPNATVFNLEQNYRSTQTILSAANAIILRNSSHPVLNLWTENPQGEGISIYNAPNEVFEANFIVERILSSKLPFSSFGVLYRTNAQSRTVEEAFLHANIPYKLYGGVRFYDRKEVKDVLSYLRLIDNPKDLVAKRRAEKLGKRRFEKFGDLRKEIDEKREKLTPIEYIDRVLAVTDYLLVIDDGTEAGAGRVENVKELRSVAADFEDLSSLLENITLMEGKVTPQKSFEQKSEAESVTLMTAHAAKGLEFDVVFVIGMEEGLFPHARSLLDPSQLEEERRLAYVATTRARKKLYLSYTTQRLYFGTTSANMVSRFVTDIPEELIANI